MKKLIGLILSGAIAAAMIPQAFAEKTLTALDEAFYRIGNGTAFLKADTTWERNNATQAEKTAAVLDYVNEYLTGVLSGVTAAVAYDNGEYSVTLSENSISKTLSLNAMNFAYYVQGAADDFNYTGENTVPSYTMMVLTDNKTKTNPQGGNYNGVFTINEDTSSHFAKLLTRFHDEYVLNPIGKSYVYKTRIKVDDFINIPEDKQVGDEWHTALTTVKNQVTDLEFTIEADGVYYKTVNEENTAVWKKIQGYTTDTDWHDYKVIVKDGIASMYIDNVETLTDIVLPAEAGYVDYPGMTFGYLSGSEKTAESDNVSVSLDYFDIKNLYEHEVFIADMSGFENQNIFLNEDNAYQTQKLTVGSKEISTYCSNTTEEKNLIYKLPENASIKDVKIIGKTPSTVDLYKYYPGNITSRIINRNKPQANLASVIPLYPHNVVDNDNVNYGAGIFNVFLSDDGYNTANNNEFDILKIYSPMVKNEKKPIIRLEIEYDYFYSTDDNVVLADDMNFSVPNEGHSNQYNGYFNWLYVLNNGWMGYGWSKGYGNGSDNITGTYFKNATQIVQLYKPFYTDFGDEYTYSSDIWIDKAAAEKVQSDHDLITDIISGSGYELKFSPCIKDSSVKYWANGENGAEWKTAENITIKDKEFNAYRAVVKNGTAILYVNGNKVAEYNMPNGTLQYTPGYGEDPDRKAIIAVLREKGTQTGNDVVSRIKNVLIVDNSEPELIAGIRALGGEAVLDGNGNMVITFSENKIGKSCRAYAAVYDSAGKLIDVRASDMNESIDGSVVLTIPYNAENELKLFFWDGLQIPVHDALTK